MNEEWRPVYGKIGYEVSNHGNIRSFWKKIYQKGKMGCVSALSEECQRHISLRKMNGGYLICTLGNRKDKIKTPDQYLVHVLVLEAFVCPRKEGFEVCHNNGNPSDNRLSNLRWGTRKENNSTDKIRTGTYGLKLSEDQVKEIVFLCRERTDLSDSKIASRFGVTRSMINCIRLGKSWSHIHK